MLSTDTSLLSEPQAGLSGGAATSSACTDRLWDSLCGIPSVFGRLVAIAEMRNSSSGRYESPMCSLFGAEAVDRALREMHREIFGIWMGFRIQQQQRDLTIWLASLNLGVAEGLQVLQARSKRLDALLPPNYAEPERELFFQEFQLVSTMVRWADVEAGMWFWPDMTPGGDEETAKTESGLCGWFKSRFLFRKH
jgi:hypothetical protein